jgi:Fic family protein
MNNLLLVFILGIVVGGVVFWCRGRKLSGKEGKYSDRSQSKERDNRKAQILGLFDVGDRVVNNDVEALLGVSDATATRYLQELEDEGKIKQIGTEGTAVYYIRS